MSATTRKLLGIVAGKAAASMNSRRYWQHWRPRTVGLLILGGFRADLRGRNLFDSGRGPQGRSEILRARPETSTDVRSLDGTYNDLASHNVLMGSVGSRFGRNRKLALSCSEPMPRLLTPDPAEISLRLMKRTEFKPADNLNLLAAAWIQFQIHDWFDHGHNDLTDPILINWPAGSARYGQCPMQVERTRRDPDSAADPTGPAMFAAASTHWWDGSQLYGVEASDARKRMAAGGEMEVSPDIIPDLRGTAGNSWVGLNMMEILFRKEHNAIASALRSAYPDMSDEVVYQKARLVNAALQAKIHTLDWTTAMLSHETSVLGLRRIWWGFLANERGHRLTRRVTRNAFWSGIPGSRRSFHGVDYSVTEEFVAVYRMHPLLPDDIRIQSLSGAGNVTLKGLIDVAVPHIEEVMNTHPLVDLFYSLGTAKAGRITLNNYPEALRDFSPPADSEKHIDLAAVDILRNRERGVPRYNDFRRMLHLKPIRSFDELGEDATTVQALRELYADVEDIDLLVGLYGEKCPAGFAFSETAFRVFLLMAERRLEADRFFTTDFNAKTYTQIGYDWVQRESMRSVLLRHFPELKNALSGIENPFNPWVENTAS